MRSILRRPSIHFLAIGLVLFAGGRLLALDQPHPAPIELDAARVAELRSNWMRLSGKPPSSRQLEAIVREAVDEEILFREAIAAGLMDTDSVVRQRLLLNAQFLGLGDASDGELLQAARDLELHLSDPVVRRRLVQVMRSAIFAGARGEVVESEEQQLRDRYQRDASSFVVAPRLRMSHVFFGRRRDGTEVAEARDVLKRLQQEQLPVDEAIALGDPFLRGHHLALLSQRELEGYFGPDLASAVFDFPVGRWSGPVESAYGTHLVWVETLQPARQQPFEEVRQRVRSDWIREREQQRLRKVLDELREDYEIRVAEIEEDESS